MYKKVICKTCEGKGCGICLDNGYINVRDEVKRGLKVKDYSNKPPMVAKDHGFYTN